jgi:hypothetical protein
MFDDTNDLDGGGDLSVPDESFACDDHNSHNDHTALGDLLSQAIDPLAEALGQAVAIIEDAIGRCREEPGALATDAFRDALTLVWAKDQGERYRLRVALKKALPDGVRLSDIEKTLPLPTKGRANSSVADALVSLVTDRAELFHAGDGSCFAVLNEIPRKTFKLDTQAFVEWLSYAYYRDAENEKGPGRAASDSAIKMARMVLTGIAKNDGPERKVYLRVARQGDAYYLDLGAEDWHVVEITANGWRIVEHAPVYFWRSSTSRPLPLPVPGGDLDLLWQYANIPAEARPLVVAWMLEAWRPETPFPILELIGQHGTTKSSTQAKLRRCIDPNAVDLRAAQQSVKDLFVSAGCNWLACYNNLSHLSASVQDALCNLATGGGFAGRTLYTNADETLVEAKRPVVINGIVPLVTAQDLTDRMIHVELPEIATYRSETEIDHAFEQDAPLILGGLLDWFVLTLQYLPRVTLERPPRMADFASLGEAPGHFMALYTANRNDSMARNLDASPVAVALRALAEAREDLPQPVFMGTMGQLFSQLECYRESTEAWPKSARGLGNILRCQQPALAQSGLIVKIGKHGRAGTPVTIYKQERDRRDDGEGPSETLLQESDAMDQAAMPTDPPIGFSVQEIEEATSILNQARADGAKVMLHDEPDKRLRIRGKPSVVIRWQAEVKVHEILIAELLRLEEPPTTSVEAEFDL